MVFGTNDAKVLLPRTIADGMVTSAASTSTVSRLSSAEPMRFGEVDIVTFNDQPRAEFVGEGDQKSSTSGSFGSVTAKPRKAQVTMRFSEEVQWLDEDHQLGVLSQLANAGAVALSRALDLGLIHRINPLTGQTIAGWDNYLNRRTGADPVKVITPTAGEDADATLLRAVQTLQDANDPTTVSGAAFDPRFVASLVGLKEINGGKPTGRRRYPELGFGVGVTAFDGLPVAVGNTVGGTPEAPDTGVRAIVGDFESRIRWGIQRQIPVHLIRYGDPDGQGDLSRKNQIALRLEIVYAWHVFANRFAVITAPAAQGASAPTGA